jgi:PIN domain nuclease of toxin-antitoxin system
VLVVAGKLPALETLSVADVLLPGAEAFNKRRIQAKLLTSLSLPRTFATNAMVRYDGCFLSTEKDRCSCCCISCML